MTRSREIQIAAILGRFYGDRAKAHEYCLFVASEHPRLAEEYKKYAEEINANLVPDKAQLANVAF